MKSTVVVLVLIAAAAGATVYFAPFGSSELTDHFKTAEVKRGNLLISVTSTGTVEPEELIDVGAQVQGKITSFGADPRAATDPRYSEKHIDYGSPVDEETVLAFIDPLVYRATRDQSQAALDRAKADLSQLQARLVQAEAEWKRAQRLVDLNLQSLSGITGRQGSSASIRGISDSDYVLAKANFDIARANVDVGQTAIDQAKATLNLAQTNLDYTVIKSPIRGTVIDRRVNVGQTVVASLNAPSLFLIAKDLRRMEVWASVNEADIGKLKIDMPVNFTVDSFPDEVFRGQVSQIRFNATLVQNVVLYTVIITTDNSSLRLIPYLTADVKFEIEERKDVLLVPNSALGWMPQAANVSPAFRDRLAELNSLPETDTGKPDEGRGGPGSSGGPEGRPAVRAKPKVTHGTLWVQDEEFVRPIEVQVGPSDGLLTEVSGSEVSEGLEVVIGENRKDAGGDAKNPFSPQIFRGKGGRRGK